MKKIYRAHPLMILTYMKPFLFVLFLPFIRGLIQYFADREVTSILGIEIVIFSIITAYAVLSWWSFRLVLRENTVMIRSGIILAKRVTINISSLSSIQSERGPIDAIFKSVTYSINTEAGRKNKSDFKFKLHLKDKYLVTITYKNKEYKLEGFIDTGNRLKSPISNKPIILVNLKLPLENVLYIPFKALNHDGIIPCIKPDKIEIDGIKIDNCLIGISKDKFSLNGLNCILPNKLKEIL